MQVVAKLQSGKFIGGGVRIIPERMSVGIFKFDQFGDWYLFKNPNLVMEIFKATMRNAADDFYYDVDR